MNTDLATLLNATLGQITEQTTADGLEKIRLDWLGKKGILPAKMKELAGLSETERPEAGKAINEIKQTFCNALEDKQNQLAERAIEHSLKRERFDITMPGRQRNLGSRHPVSLARERVEHFFIRHGFAIEQGPEIEDDFHNFAALNIGESHPARAMQDTFYVDPNTVLRTHTSNVQIRTMETQTPPLRMIAPGRVYRSDSDVTHTPMFHQIEGMWIDEGVTFADLKGVLIAFLRDFFDDEQLAVRFRPSYFPFTEPSAEVDIACSCQQSKTARKQKTPSSISGQNCRICGGTGWLEVLGSGMMHPAVLRNGGIDPEKYTGYAFGTGIERLAMLRYQASDLRTFFENDVRFLAPFH